MNDMGDDHKCNICNKIYSSYKTLWKHNKNKHKNNVFQNKPIINQNKPIINQNKPNINQNKPEINEYNCRYCNKIYFHIQSRWKHEQKCKVIFDEKEKQNNEIKLAEIKIAEINKEIKLAEINSNKEIKLAEINSNKEIELKKVEIKKENSIIRQKTNRNPTIKNINKLLQNRIIASSDAYIGPSGLNMNNSNLNSNNTNTTNNIQNNTVHNHFKIEGFGKENILDTITDKEKKLILNQGCESIEKLIEIVYVGKYDQFKNILITNKRENDIYTYDDKSDLYIINDKNLVLNKLVANRLGDVEEIYNEFDENNKLTDINRKTMSRFFIKFVDEDKPYIDENSNNKEYKNYIDYKVNKVNNLLFNNQDKIIKDVTSAIEKDSK
jgi:hypothetical protein